MHTPKIMRLLPSRTRTFLADSLGEYVEYVAPVSMEMDISPKDTKLGKLVVRDGHLAVVGQEAAEGQLTDVIGGEAIGIVSCPKRTEPPTVNAALVRLLSPEGKCAGQLVVTDWKHLVRE
jgi:hypothetical protein